MHTHMHTHTHTQTRPQTLTRTCTRTHTRTHTHTIAHTQHRFWVAGQLHIINTICKTRLEVLLTAPNPSINSCIRSLLMCTATMVHAGVALWFLVTGGGTCKKNDLCMVFVFYVGFAQWCEVTGGGIREKVDVCGGGEMC